MQLVINTKKKVSALATGINFSFFIQEKSCLTVPLEKKPSLFTGSEIAHSWYMEHQMSGDSQHPGRAPCILLYGRRAKFPPAQYVYK